MTVKYPNVSVQLVGQDGNAFAIMGRVIKALRKAKVSDAEVKAFQTEAMSGDYDNLLATCMRWVECDGETDDLPNHGDWAIPHGESK